tara:strand:- start:288 stop:518 length:231 start_codon:yes stop_codon:yes gene_type:complete
MDYKGFKINQRTLETPDTLNVSEKPLKTNEAKPPRVDINVLKSKLMKDEEKQFKKNLATFLSFVVSLGALGIYLSI